MTFLLIADERCVRPDPFDPGVMANGKKIHRQPGLSRRNHNNGFLTHFTKYRCNDFDLLFILFIE